MLAVWSMWRPCPPPTTLLGSCYSNGLFCGTAFFFRCCFPLCSFFKDPHSAYAFVGCSGIHTLQCRAVHAILMQWCALIFVVWCFHLRSSPPCHCIRVGRFNKHGKGDRLKPSPYASANQILLCRLLAMPLNNIGTGSLFNF